MSYIGKTYQVSCEKGGLSYSKNRSIVPADCFVPPSKNINLDQKGRFKRGGTAYTSDASYNEAITGTPDVLSVFQFILNNGTKKLITHCSGGSVWTAHDTKLIDGTWATSGFTAFTVMDNECYLATRGKVPQKYTGAAVAAVGAVPTDWVADGPGWVVTHGRGNSERTWWGWSNTYPNRIYASAVGDGDDVSDANCFTMDISTQDGFGIIGACSFGDRLFLFGKSKVYILDDTDLSPANWGYAEAQWSGGAATHRLIVRTPNDIMVMAEDGIIYSVATAEQYGDYKAATQMYENDLHIWMKENISLTSAALLKSFAVYDPNLRAIKWFLVVTGGTDPSRCLVQFIDHQGRHAFTYHENPDYASGYGGTSGVFSACIYRDSNQQQYVMTGDGVGRLWILESATLGDNSEAYWAGFTTPWIDCGDPRQTKQFKRGHVITGGEDLSDPLGIGWGVRINWWVDESSTAGATNQVWMMGDGVKSDSTVPLGTFVASSAEIADIGFPMDKYGRRAKLQIFNDAENERFYINGFSLDYKPVGGKSEV